MRTSFLALVNKLPTILCAIMLSACAHQQSSYNIDFPDLSSRLIIEAEKGGQVGLPKDGRLVIDDQFGISEESIQLMPGKHGIRFLCPPAKVAVGDARMLPQVVFDHGPPEVVYDFKVGHTYVLRCRNGFVDIQPAG